MSIDKNKTLHSNKKSKKKKYVHKTDPLITGLISIKNYYNSLDYATGGLLKFLTIVYGAKKANDIWRWCMQKETFTDSQYTIRSSSVVDTIKRINFLMYGTEDIGHDSSRYVLENYEKNLPEINLLTYRLNEIDNLYTYSKKEPFFSPLSAVYISEHILEDGMIKYRPYPKSSEKTPVSGSLILKQFGKSRKRSHKRRSHKRIHKIRSYKTNK